VAYESASRIECFYNNDANEKIVNKYLDALEGRTDCFKVPNLLWMLLINLK